MGNPERPEKIIVPGLDGTFYEVDLKRLAELYGTEAPYEENTVEIGDPIEFEPPAKRKITEDPVPEPGSKFNI